MDETVEFNNHHMLDTKENDPDAPAFALPHGSVEGETSEAVDDSSPAIDEVDLLNFSSHPQTDEPPATATDLLGLGDDLLLSTPATNNNDTNESFPGPADATASDLLSGANAAVMQGASPPVDLLGDDFMSSPASPAENTTAADHSLVDVFAATDNFEPNLSSPKIGNSEQTQTNLLDDTDDFLSVVSSSASQSTRTQELQQQQEQQGPIVADVQTDANIASKESGSMDDESAATPPNGPPATSVESSSNHHNGVSNDANSQQDDTALFQKQIHQLQQESNDKDALIHQLQQQLTAAADEIQEQESLHTQLQEQQQTINQLQQAEQSWQTQLTDLQEQVAAANRHAEGFKTDQARYRELQSLWSTEQSKRTQAEERVKETEATIEQLQGALQQQENDNKSLRGRLEDLRQETTDQLQSVNERVQILQQENDVLQEQVKELNQQVEETNAKNSEDRTLNELRQVKLELETKAVELETLQKELADLRQERERREKEFRTLKMEHDEQHRKEMALTNRLNAAKKTEAEKANLAEKFEDELEAVKEELQVQKLETQNLQTAKEGIEHDFAKYKKVSQTKLEEVEAALNDERSLNEERKKKMKAFVETKADELRQLQTDNEALQSEVATTSKSLMDLNTRWKQLHAQWVQSQTRNRELQRDLNRIKKDSENLHKVGDNIQMKLSRSTNETEEHKNKRLAAKHELMTVLRALEAERELTGRLRDSIKYTFTPKALSQQQLIHEALDEFESQLLKVSQRLAVPLPPMAAPAPTPHQAEESSNFGDGASLDDDITKLDHETQRVSQNIMALSDNIERLRVILEIGGARSCASFFGDLLMTGNFHQPSPGSIPDDRTPMTGSGMSAIRSHAYGQIPRAPQLS